MSLTIQQLSPIGAQIVDPDIDYLLNAPGAGKEVMDALGQSSVLFVRGLHLDDETQIALGRRLGEIVLKNTPGWSKEVPGIYRIALDPAANDELYVKGAWDWHIDGATSNGIPPRASMLSCRVAPAPGTGGETQAVSTYLAYDRLSAAEKQQLEGLKVWHRVDPSRYTHVPFLTPEQQARVDAEPSQLHPLVWTHRDGRKSLVVGITATHIEGMPLEAGAALLKELNDRSTTDDLVLTHTWEIDDVLIWDNTGTMHRGRPFTQESGRDMHRCTLVGEEPIQ